MMKFPFRVWEPVEDINPVFNESLQSPREWASHEATQEDKARRAEILKQFGNKWPTIPNE